MKTIHLEPNQIPPGFTSYKGRKLKAVVCEKVTLSDTYWSGGTRSTYTAMQLSTGERVAIARNSAPSIFGTDYDGTNFPLKPDIAIVEHSIFCGKDMGLTFYVHPDNAAKLLPDQTDGNYSDAELCLLAATSRLKSSYAGRKPRIDMMHANNFDNVAIEQAKTALIEKGLLRKNGSITTKGRNVETGQWREY